MYEKDVTYEIKKYFGDVMAKAVLKSDYENGLTPNFPSFGEENEFFLKAMRRYT